MATKNHFELINVVRLKDLASGQVTQVGEADLSFQDDEYLYQFKFNKVEDHIYKYPIKPGFWNITHTMRGVEAEPMKFRERRLLERFSGTAAIIKEARTFFDRLHVYERVGRPKKRGVLLYSVPGCGKSASIEKFCTDFAKEDPGTVVFLWAPSKVDPGPFMSFLSSQAEYSEDCTRLILIIEDIGGFSYGEQQPVDPSLLNLLDGVGAIFKLPTFIVATTNHPESLLASLANRPGRFDMMMEIKPPTYEERIELLSFFAGRPLTDEEKECLNLRGTENFTVAHMEEIVVRSQLHDKSFKEVVVEMIQHAELFNRAFQGERRMGFGG